MSIFEGKQAVGLHKASGLELGKPQGALAEGQCGLGSEGTNGTGLE